MKEKEEYKTVQSYAHELAQRIAKHAELRRKSKSGMEVNFIVKFYPNDGEIISVIRKCKLPCQCEECAFKEICNSIENRIISINKQNSQ